MAKGWLGDELLDSFKVVRIHALKALNSWSEDLSYASLLVKKRSEYP